MIPIRCRTNLDDVGKEQWPVRLHTVPRVGDFINSGTTHRDGCYVQLEVVAVTWIKDGSTGWIAEVEMHLPKRWGNITEFQRWYDKIRGKL